MKKLKSPSKSTSSLPMVTILNVGTTLTGKIHSEHDIRIEGNFNGEIESAQRVFVTEKAIFNGILNAHKVEISGNMTGTINASESLSIYKTAKIEGEISTPNIYVESGAIFNGKCNMVTKKAPNTTSKPEKNTTTISKKTSEKVENEPSIVKMEKTT